MKLIISADIHGRLTPWLTLKSLLDDTDHLVIAGDLFDTRYGRYTQPDFAPEDIRRDLNEQNHPFHYVYGNCDEPSFFPGYDHTLTFQALGRLIFLCHGHHPHPAPPGTDIVIEGHTHQWQLTRTGDRIFLNPGSLAKPRQCAAAFAIMDHTGIEILSAGNLARLEFLAF